MDDINFGVDDKPSAKVILGEISDVLKSCGLSLNLGKTDLMTSKEAEYHFMFKENVKLSEFQSLARRLKRPVSKINLARLIQRRLVRHLGQCKARNKDKVTKRFLSILGILGVPLGLTQAKSIYIDQPSLRQSVLRFLSRLPFTGRVCNVFLELLNEIPYDDVTRFSFVEAIVSWKIPFSRKGNLFVASVREELQKTTTSFDWLCLLVFLSKYGEPHELLTVANQWRAIGAKEPFFARQRMTAIVRGLGINSTAVLSQWEKETSTGSSDSASVANNLLGFTKASFPRKRERLHFYLFPETRQEPYPLPKFLVLCALAFSEAHAGKIVVRPEISSYVTDPWYRHWLELIHPSWF